MTTSEEILLMKKKYAADHGGEEANVLYISDPKWREWWNELARVGNPHVNDKLALAVSRKGFAAMKGQIWHGLRVERLNPSNQPQYKTFVERETVVAATVTDDPHDSHDENVLHLTADSRLKVNSAVVAKAPVQVLAAKNARRRKTV